VAQKYIFSGEKRKGNLKFRPAFRSFAKEGGLLEPRTGLSLLATSRTPEFSGPLRAQTCRSIPGRMMQTWKYFLYF